MSVMTAVLLYSMVAVPPTDLPALLKQIDQKLTSPGDYTAEVYLEQKQAGKEDLAFQLLVYRRDEDQSLIFLFKKPKTRVGEGFLRKDRNLWSYNPGVGRWNRQTARTQVAGTDARTRDFDQWNLAEEYDAEYLTSEKLGAFTAHKIKLRAKPNMDVAFPIMELWIDSATNNPLKIGSYALSERLMQTSYYPKWVRVESKSGGVYYPEEIRIYDELTKGNETIIKVQKAQIAPLPSNIFTKAWLESQSR